MDDAVRFVIGMQEQAGIDIISDGEWRRESYVDIVGEIMHGFQLGQARRVRLPSGRHRADDAAPARAWSPRRPASSSRTPTARVKVCLPSPYLIGQRMWVPEHSAGGLSDARGVLRGARAGAAQELLAIRDVGVDVIQLDEPHLCVLVDPQMRAKFADPEAEMNAGRRLDQSDRRGRGGRDAGGPSVPAQLGPARLGGGRRL